MSTIQLKIVNNGDNKGTVGYLAKHAAAIKLGDCKPLYDGDQRRGAWLLDHTGQVITFLVDSGGEKISDDPGHEYQFTEAAREVIDDLIGTAEDLLSNEDATAERPIFSLSKE